MSISSIKGELYFPAWMYIIKYIDDKNGRMENVHVASRELDITYSHLSKVLQTMQKCKWVSTSKNGRIKIIKFTPAGTKKAEAIRWLLG